MAKPVKIKLLIFLCAGVVLCAGCSSEPYCGVGRAVFPDCEFAPLQTGVWLTPLVGQEADCIIIFTPLLVITKQKSGIISVSGATMLENNYGILCTLGAEVRRNNYGVACGYGLEGAGNNYGLQIGCFIINRSGEPDKRMQGQLLGMNIAERLLIGLVNISSDSWLNIGVFNSGESTFLQIGVLNHNERALLPWFPLFNFRWYGDENGQPK